MRDRAADLQQIIEATYRHARGVDRADPEEAIRAFTDDAVWDATALGFERLVGRESLLNFLRSDAVLVAEQFHILANHIIEFDGPTTAHGTCYLFSEARTKSGSFLKVAMLNEDSYRETSVGWQIAVRVVSLLTTPHIENPHYGAVFQ